MRAIQCTLGITVVLLVVWEMAPPFAQDLPPKDVPPAGRPDTPLPDGALARLGKVSPQLLGSAPDPRGVVLLVPSPDGKRVAVGQEEKSLVVWDLETKRPVARMAGPRGPLRSLAFSLDGKVL